MKNRTFKKLAAAAVAASMLLSSMTAFAAGEYTTKSGDNLSKIAQELYGDNTKWRDIYEANKEQIKDPNMIWANQTLVIPDVDDTIVTVPTETEETTEEEVITEETTAEEETAAEETTDVVTVVQGELTVKRIAPLGVGLYGNGGEIERNNPSDNFDPAVYHIAEDNEYSNCVYIDFEDAQGQEYNFCPTPESPADVWLSWYKENNSERFENVFLPTWYWYLSYVNVGDFFTEDNVDTVYNNYCNFLVGEGYTKLLLYARVVEDTDTDTTNTSTASTSMGMGTNALGAGWYYKFYLYDITTGMLEHLGGTHDAYYRNWLESLTDEEYDEYELRFGS